MLREIDPASREPAHGLARATEYASDMRRRRQQVSRSRQASEHIIESVEAISALYERTEHNASRDQRVIELITSGLGRPSFLYGVLVLLAAWILLNLCAPLYGLRALDPPPFNWLQGIVGLSALLLSTMILITQNREGRLLDQRAHLDLQVNLLAEKKIAKVIELIEELRRDLPSVKNRLDTEAQAMSHPADPGMVVRALQDQQEKDDATSNSSARERLDKDRKPDE